MNLSRQYQGERNGLVRELRAEDSKLWTYQVLAKAIGISPEMAAAIVKGRTGGSG